MTITVRCVNYSNHRILRRVYTDEDNSKFESFGVYVVFYDEDMNPVDCFSEPSPVCGWSSAEDASEEAKEFALAAEKPVLNYEDVRQRRQDDEGFT